MIRSRLPRFLTASFACLSCFAVVAKADDHHSGRRKLADKQAPAGIMGDHIHQPGQWMVEYKYMNMCMEDNRIGTQTVSDQAAIDWGATSHPVTNRGATPTQMTMEMHMMHFMYGWTEDISLYSMVMLPALTMDHLRGPGNPAGSGTSFTTHNSGMGDLGLGALMRLYSDERNDWLLNLGCSVPTGDLYRTSSAPTAGMMNQPLPYPMRLGSGMFNARPGVTYRHFFDLCSFGSQATADLPIGRNDRGYRLGEHYRLSNWFQCLMTDNWALSIRDQHDWRNNVSGQDPDATDMLISTNVENFRGGYWYSLAVGTQFTVGKNYFNAEIVPTIGQNLDGIQLETDYSIIASWSLAF